MSIYRRKSYCPTGDAHCSLAVKGSVACGLVCGRTTEAVLRSCIPSRSSYSAPAPGPTYSRLSCGPLLLSFGLPHSARHVLPNSPPPRPPSPTRQVQTCELGRRFLQCVNWWTEENEIMCEEEVMALGLLLKCRVWKRSLSLHFVCI